MTRMRRLQKGMNPPGVGGGKSKVKKKCINRKQQGIRHQRVLERIVGQLDSQIDINQIWLMWIRRMYQLIESRSGLGPHSRREAWKRNLTKVSITVSPFYNFVKMIYLLLCFYISPCELVCIICIISPYLLHHFTIMRRRSLLLHHFTTVFHNFTMWTCVYYLHHL